MILQEADAANLAAQVVARCRELSKITDVPGETTRTFLSEGMRRANECVAGWMREAGMQTAMDAVGNLRGVLPAGRPDAATVMIASHLDTVPNAGAFDGPLGVLMGVALAQRIGAGTLPFALEVIAFSEEEGVRFGVPFIGSRGLAGTLDDAVLATRDSRGTSVKGAMAEYGLPAEFAAAQLRNAAGYLEFHIEQGPELDAENLSLAVVETIAGQSRFLLTFRGEANHAGTTPMRLRHDALCAAASFIVAAEKHASNTHGLVATVGSIQAEPNAANVIAGEVRISLDVRSANDTTRERAVEHLLSVAEQVARERGVRLYAEQRLNQAAVPLDRTLMCVLEESMDDNGTVIRRMASGAGHDAMIIAPHLPTAMLFLRSPGGVSHHPEESVRAGDVALALRVGYTFLYRLAAQSTTGEPA